MNNRRYLLALNRMEKVGPLTIMKLMKRWPNLQEMFELSQVGLIEAGLPLALAERISTFNWQTINEDLRWQETDNHHLLTWVCPEYPALLREIHDPPMVLYAKGDLSVFKQTSIAVVGTRKPSMTGSETARYFARELSKHAITVVSGLALGIDASAHQGCLDVDGKTIAVMATGIDIIYPHRHRQLSSGICRNGLILSEFPLRTSPIAGHFPRRNRIISGLSLITLVVEAAIRSGSLITARLAMEQNRDVMAIPGSIHNPQARGCHHLLQQGAKLVTSIQDILDELNIDTKQDKLQDLSDGELATGHKNLVKCIGDDLSSIDQIIMRSGLDVATVTCGLAELELQGLIKSVNGGYVRCIYERSVV
jgi:DNA processing protein